jgi:hypothetical protein
VAVLLALVLVVGEVVGELDIGDGDGDFSMFEHPQC